MDNLTVSTTGPTNPPPPPYGSVDIGNLTVTNLGHLFGNRGGDSSWPVTVIDYLVAQSPYIGGGGGAMLPNVSADFDTNNQFALTISAPAGQKFLIQPPGGQPVNFSGSMDWTYFPGFANDTNQNVFGTVAVTFGGLQGTAPDFSASSSLLTYRHGLFGFNDVLSAPFTNALAFTSVTLTATVPASNSGSGTLGYTPDIDDSFAFVSSVNQTNDPGSFTGLVPLSYPLGQPVNGPKLSIQVGPNGDVVVTFSGGVLQCATQSNGPFTDMPGNPSGTYTIPKTNLTAAQHFRVRGQ